jgi:hypothetical protein
LISVALWVRERSDGSALYSCWRQAAIDRSPSAPRAFITLSLAERICGETKTLAEFQPWDVLDYIGYLKPKGAAAPEAPSSSSVSDNS